MKFNFLDVCTDVTKTAMKIPQNEYSKKGSFPIFDQGKKYISGYTNSSESLAEDTPYIVFGDHTRIIKYVNVPCFIGADGVKLLKVTNNEFITKYVYYSLVANPIENQGYSRHYKLLKETKVVFVDKDTQQDIISELDNICDLIAIKENQLFSLDELIKSRFIEMFMDENNKDKYPIQKWSEVVKVKHGKDYKKNIVENGGYPVYGSGGFMGVYADSYLVNENAIIIGRKGTIDKPILIKEKFWNVDTAFGIEVNEEILNPIFFYVRSTMYDLKSMSTSTTLPSMTKDTLHNIDIGIPPIKLQNEFASFVYQIDKSKFIIQNQLKDLNEIYHSKLDKYFK